MRYGNVSFYTGYRFPDFRDWSLITGRGGYKTGGGQVKFYPYEKGGQKRFSHAEGGSQKVLG